MEKGGLRMRKSGVEWKRAEESGEEWRRMEMVCIEPEEEV